MLIVCWKILASHLARRCDTSTVSNVDCVLEILASHNYQKILQYVWLSPPQGNRQPFTLPHYQPFRKKMGKNTLRCDVLLTV